MSTDNQSKGNTGSKASASQGHTVVAGTGNDSASDNPIAEYGPLILVVLVIVLFMTGGFFGYKYYNNQKLNTALNMIESFHKDSLARYEKGDVNFTEEAFFKKLEDLKGEIGTQRPYGSLVLSLSQKFLANNKAQLVVNILEPSLKDFSKDKFLYYLMAVSLSAAYEDTGKLKEAISLNEELLKKEVVFLKSKIYFDLGRYYKKENQMDKAKLNFQYVVDNFPDDKMAHLSRVYLRKL